MNPIRQRILYVEDHEDTSELISLVLQQQNYEVVLDRTVASALRTAREQHFDLYLLDSRLPDGSGVDLCKEIRKFDLSTPVMFYSAAAYDIDRALALRSGAQAYLMKPSRFQELCELVSSLICKNATQTSGRITSPGAQCREQHQPSLPETTSSAPPRLAKAHLQLQE
jgi:DNA-binding response OmpR family regulator